MEVIIRELGLHAAMMVGKGNWQVNKIARGLLRRLAQDGSH